ncbi:ABC transporter permease [Candidatus Bathyarchaeota archaeon]|nr:ABC transporter permease [Candidatus Bathyarchaeota archaeon]
MVSQLIRDLLRIKKFDLSVAIFSSILIIGLVGPIVYEVDPVKMIGPPEQPPSEKYPLGTDSYGRDLLAQLLHGIRNSIYIGLTAAAISLAIGVTIGALSGYRGGVVDSSLMLVTDVVYALPSIMLMMLIAAYLKERNPVFVALVIGITSWPWVARAVRSQMLSLKSRDFIYMSRMAGLSDIKIIFEDLIPNMASYIFMAFVLLMSGAMIAEAGLSMIGLGVTRGVSLGIILYWAQLLESVRRGIWWWFIPPGACLVTLATSLLLLSTALDEYFSPRLRGG